MKASSQTLRLEDIAELTNGGAWNQEEYADSGIPVTRVSDVHGGTVDLSSCKFLPESSLSKYAKNQLLEGDLIICTVGSHPTQPGSVVGRAGIVPRSAKGSLLNQNAVCIRPRTDQIDKRWLGYIGKSESFHDYIKAHARGSASQVRMAIGLLKEMPVAVPDLPTQRKIAGILSAYDDLIENNLRRIKILEQMAQSLYRAWFVHFRFPGHETVKMVDSPLGKIPEGWEVKKLGELADINAKSIRATNVPAEIHYIDIASVSTGAIDKIDTMTFDSAPSRARRVVRHGDIIWSTVRPNRRSFSLIIEPTDNLIVSTGFAVLSARTVPWSYLYQATTTEDFTSYLVNHASGAAYPAVNSGIFENADIVVPPCDLLKRFNALAEPNQMLQTNLHRRNQNLSRTRDLLLPKLI